MDRWVFWCIEILVGSYGGGTLSVSFSTGERLSGPHIWWLVCGLCMVFCAVSIALVIGAVVTLISTLMVTVSQ